MSTNRIKNADGTVSKITESTKPGSIDLRWDEDKKIMLARTSGFPDSLQSLLALEHAVIYAKKEEMDRRGISEAELKIVSAQIFYEEGD